MRISDWSSDVCSSDLIRRPGQKDAPGYARRPQRHRCRDGKRATRGEPTSIIAKPWPVYVGLDPTDDAPLKINRETGHPHHPLRLGFRAVYRDPMTVSVPVYSRPMRGPTLAPTPRPASSLADTSISLRSAERRVGNTSISKFRFLWSPDH